jgi:membrane dipeptidase
MPNPHGHPPPPTALAAACLLALACDSGTRDPGPPPDPRAEEIHRAAIVIDGHNDAPMWILESGFDLGMDGADPRKKSVEPWMLLMRFLTPPAGAELRTHTDLRRLERGGVDAQFFSIFADPRGRGPGEYRTRAIEMIEALLGQFVQHAGRLTLAVSARDIREAAAAGKIAGLMGLEGGHAIEDDLDNVENFYNLGIRYMTLTWSNTNGWADSSGDVRRHGGLTDFGREVVLEMNRLGMLVDVSHVSDETFWDAIEVSRAPVIASHSSARALVDVPRNMSDEMLSAVAANGGVVMINFGGTFIDPRKAGTGKAALDMLLHLGPSPVPLDRLLDQIDHVARVAGIDHVGLGSDFDGTLFLPEGARDVAGFPNITGGLLARGYSEEKIRKILGENLLRVFAQAEAVAGR